MKHHTLNPEQWNLSYREYLLRFALQRISDYGSAEDLVQDTFLSGWNARRQFRGDCSEKTWLTGILRNKIIDHYRRNSRRPSVIASDLDGPADESGSVSWMDRQPDLRPVNRPGSETDKREFLDELDRAVNSLPEKMGLAYRMREIEGQSTEEITRKLGITKANLWVLIHRAKQALGEQLEANWGDLEEFGGRMAA